MLADDGNGEDEFKEMEESSQDDKKEDATANG